MDSTIIELIRRYENPGDFTHAVVSNTQIAEAQEALALILPIQYIEFLRNYGHGGIGGVEIIGIGKNGESLFVEETKKYRTYGLPVNLIVIENCDEWLYCIDSINATIVSWTKTDTTYAFPDFNSYLKDRFTDAVENL